ncbi:hypothetical protein [Xanthobacter sp. KR7-225]
MHLLGIIVLLLGLGLVAFDCRGWDQLVAALILVVLVSTIVHMGTR